VVEWRRRVSTMPRYFFHRGVESRNLGFDYAEREPEIVDADVDRCDQFLFSAIGDRVHVSMGSLADTPSIRSTENIFVGSKPAWDEITDGLPQYAGHFLEGPPTDR
jgi:hypothetical protein